MSTTIPRTLTTPFSCALHAARNYVSPLGWLCLAVSALCGGVWWAWGWAEMLVLASFGAIVFIGAIIVSLGNTGFGASIALTRTRISEGDSVGVIITVTNASKAPTVRARARITIGDQHESFAIAPLAPGQKKPP